MSEPEKLHSIFDEPPDEGVRTIDETPSEPAADKPGGDHLKMSIPTGGVDPFDHSAEVAAARAQQAKDGTLPPDMPETKTIPPHNPAMGESSADALRDEMEARFAHDAGELKGIKATAADRDAFARAALHDSELVFDIPVEGLGVTVQVAVPPDDFTTSAAAALSHWEAGDVIDKDSGMQWLLAFQQIHAWYQIRAVDGVPTPWSDYWAGEKHPPLSDIRAKMKDASTFDPIFSLGAVRWRMLLYAIRAAEAKYRICLQRWNDRTFFIGADTD